ncbi:MAG: tetratricopeptide repeat protein [Bacteroidetes bacterium]|jgi:tetratricopeptide (TPR) repeat protein|nr:tetratricopeptide repeat protein [Bacteroidota bacterium]
MEESCNYLFDDNLEYTINRFQEMIKSRTTKFFDVHEFEELIDFYTDQHNFQYADKAVYHAIQQHPEALTIKIKEARLLLEKGIPQRAMLILDKLEPLEYANHDVYFLQGLAQLLSDNFTSAKKYMEKAAETVDDEKDEVLYQIGINLSQFGFHDDALIYLHEAHRLNKHNLLIIYELATTYEFKQNYELSARYYHKYLDQDPFAETMWNSLGQVQMENKKYDEALEAFDFAISINPMYTTPLQNKAMLFMRRLNFPKAIQVLEEVLPIDQNNTMVYNQLGECYKNLNELSGALRCYKTAASIDETNADAWYGIGMVLFQQNKYKDSTRYIQKALTYDRDNADYWFSLGDAYKKLNKTEKAINAYNNVTNIDQHDDEAWYEQALLLKRQKKINEAINLLNKAYSFNNCSARINYTLSLLYYLKKHHNLAEQYFEKGLQIDSLGYHKILNDAPRIRMDQRFQNLIRKYANQ